MSLRIVNILADRKYSEILRAIAEQHNAVGFWLLDHAENENQSANILIGSEHRQACLDALQESLGENGSWRILIMPIEGTIPPAPKLSNETDTSKSAETITREELYDDVSNGTQANSNFVWLAVLSTIVAAIGLISGSETILIGAMVIAPLLGPHLAFALATALGDYDLMYRALRAGVVGLSLGFVISFLIGLFYPFDVMSTELTSRTVVGFDVVFLALASSAAAALSATSGLSSVLVGVMVAVALMPPAVAIGLTLGAGSLDMAFGAALLLGVNMVCINLSAQVVLIARGIQPRTWLAKRAANQSRYLNLAVWVVGLLVLIFVIYLQ